MEMGRKMEEGGREMGMGMEIEIEIRKDLEMEIGREMRR
jgi:hypothetical protein